MVESLTGDFFGFSPVSKFLCVKAIVFFSWWQSLFIAIVAWVGIIQGCEHVHCHRFLFEIETDILEQPMNIPRNPFQLQFKTFS